MNSPESNASSSSHIAAAAEWVMKLDRGLTPAEQDQYLQWLALDPRHADAIASQRRVWESFDRLAGLQSSVEAVPDPDLLEPHPKRRPLFGGAGVFSHLPPFVRIVAPLAAAAALAFVFWPRKATDTAERPPIVSAPTTDALLLPPIEERVLADGSVIRLNRNAVVTVEFSRDERRVHLERGEAAFTVAKDAARPFVVMTAGVSVRAVGTAFNVRLHNQCVDVIVTQGRVAVADRISSAEAEAPIVAVGQRVIVPLEPSAGSLSVTTPPDEELSRLLAWQPRLLTFNDQPLEVILEEFNRHNPVALRIQDQALRGLRLSARFRSDNVRGFLRLLESDFGVRIDQAGNDEIALRSRP